MLTFSGVLLIYAVSKKLKIRQLKSIKIIRKKIKIDKQLFEEQGNLVKVDKNSNFFYYFNSEKYNNTY